MFRFLRRVLGVICCCTCYGCFAWIWLNVFRCSELSHVKFYTLTSRTYIKDNTAGVGFAKGKVVVLVANVQVLHHKLQVSDKI